MEIAKKSYPSNYQLVQITKNFVALITINKGLHKLRYIIHEISYIVLFYCS